MNNVLSSHTCCGGRYLGYYDIDKLMAADEQRRVLTHGPEIWPSPWMSFETVQAGIEDFFTTALVHPPQPVEIIAVGAENPFMAYL